jgi:hypothetical protein
MVEALEPLRSRKLKTSLTVADVVSSIKSLRETVEPPYLVIMNLSQDLRLCDDAIENHGTNASSVAIAKALDLGNLQFNGIRLYTLSTLPEGEETSDVYILGGNCLRCRIPQVTVEIADTTIEATCEYGCFLQFPKNGIRLTAKNWSDD